MHTFKIDDKIICINRMNDVVKIKIGHIYIVTKINTNTINIKSNETNINFSSSYTSTQFKPVKTTISMSKLYKNLI